MIDKNKARKIAMAEILGCWNIEGDESVISDEYTEERNFGWVFFYTSKRYVETENISFALAGNAPIIVNRYDGSTYTTSTAYEIEYYIREYENTLKTAK